MNLFNENRQLQKKYDKAKTEQEKSYNKLMIEYYKKIEECQSIKKSINDYDSGINKVFNEFERLQGIITNLKS